MAMGGGQTVPCQPLLLACLGGHSAAVQLLLAQKGLMFPTNGGFGPLHVAIMGYNIPIVDALLSDGRINVNGLGAKQSTTHTLLSWIGKWILSPICLAAISGFVGMLRRLIEGGALLNNNPPGVTGSLPLTMAACAGHPDAVRFLVSNGATLSPDDGTLDMVTYAGYSSVLEGDPGAQTVSGTEGSKVFSEAREAGVVSRLRELFQRSFQNHTIP